QAGNTGGTPIKVLSGVTGGKDDAENQLFQDVMSKVMGAPVTWEKPADYNTALMQKLGAGEKYDLIYMGQTQMYDLVKQGVLTDITSRLAQSQTIQANYPAGELQKIAVDGKYYAGFNKIEVFCVPNINKAITDKAGIDISNLSTLDDYYNMLKAVKNYMENTVGKKPYYPLYIYMPDIWDMQPWFSSAGLRRGVYTDSNGKRYAPYVTPAAQPVWEWLAKLNQEGLIEPMSFTGTTTNMRNMLWQSQDIVMDVDWVAWTGLYNSNAMVAGTYPNTVNVVGTPGTKGPSGKYFLEQGGASLWGIPVNATNPNGGFGIIEYFATKDGGLLLTAGIPGNDYNMVNGQLVLTDTGKAHGLDHGAPFPISTQFDFSILGQMNPGVLDSYAIGKRSDVAVETMGFNGGQLDTRQFYDVISKYMTDCMMGRTSAAAAIQGAAAELRTRGIID
ncbi:MAG: hypothetical protein FWF22_06800, partial [Treponema sp.]|nr:hypothetical protein [Treponema sp.]